jgi:hypothetical protein
MPTPKQGYFLADGTRVPGVTTILGRFKDAGPLMRWAWEEGRAGRDYRETRQAAADAGTIAHAMVEAEIHGRPFVMPEVPEDIRAKAQQAYATYREWAAQTKLQPIATEVRLVSETHRYGGTLDVILVGGRRLLGDWKTSNAVYGEYLLQLAAYGALWNEHHPQEPIEGFQLMRFSKQHPDFEARFFAELDAAWEMFLALRRAYELDKKVKERIGKR